MAPLVSVIIPVYNAEQYLRQCLDSVAGQTLREIEIICVDDGSTDGSVGILREYAAMDSRFVILSQENAGAGAARNHGLWHACGTYLSFLDADDFFEPEMLQKAVEKIEEDAADFVVFRCDQYQEDTGKYKGARYTLKSDLLPPYHPFSYRQIRGNVFRVFMGWAWDKLYRRDFISENNLLFQEQRTSNDLLFVFSALIAAKRITYFEDVLAHQRRNNAASLSNTREKSWFCFQDALTALRVYLEKTGRYVELQRDYANYALHFSLWNLNTITGQCRELLYNKLREEWFEQTGVTLLPENAFYDEKEFLQYQEIMQYDFAEYETKISVVIPVHNAENYIRQCIDSVLLKQSGIGLEVICVDDCSTDSTPRILQEYAEKYENFRYLRNETNLYAGPSRNRGLMEARGQYVHFVDSDDYVEENVYAKLYPIVWENRLDFLKTTADGFDDQTKNVVENPRYSMDKMNRGLDETLLDFRRFPFKFLEYMSLVPWNAIYNRRFLMENGIRFNDLYCVNDRSFFVETCLKAQRMMYTRQIIVHHRSNVSGSLVMKRAQHFDCQFRSYEIIADLCDENDVSERTRFEILEHEMYDMFVWYRKALEGADEETKEKLRQDMHAFLQKIDLNWYEEHGEKSRWLKYRELADV